MKKNIFGSQAPFWLIAFSILIGLTLPTLIQDGMFMDGMLYTSVSHNLSMGIGTFWFPQFSVHNIAGLSSFHEQPPLVFGIQSLFYKVFGNSMYVERFYTFLTMCITALLLFSLWKKIFKDQPHLKKMGWLPLTLWITVPVCFWSYSNNMHENTMGIFTLCAALLLYKAAQVEKFQKTWLMFAGISIFLATLSKGIPGFFPITIPFIYWITTKKISRSAMCFQTLIIAGVPLLFYSILFLIPSSGESLSIYFWERALHRINEAPTVDNRFFILQRLFMELLPQLLLITILFIFAKFKKVEFVTKKQLQESIFFISVGLSASVPLALTLVQKGFYFVPSLPFFAIGFSIFIAPVITSYTERINIETKKYKTLLITSSFLLISVTIFSFTQKGKTSRNQELLHDVYLIGKVAPNRSTISIPPEMWNDWDLQCYLIRYFNISLEANDNNNYCIINKSTHIDTLKGYRKVSISTVRYDLYIRQEQSASADTMVPKKTLEGN